MKQHAAAWHCRDIHSAAALAVGEALPVLVDDDEAASSRPDSAYASVSLFVKALLSSAHWRVGSIWLCPGVWKGRQRSLHEFSCQAKVV